MPQTLGYMLTNWLLTMHGWPKGFRVTLTQTKHCTSPPHLLPKYLQLELCRHVIHNIARFCLHAQILRAETGCMQVHNILYTGTVSI